MGYEEEYYKRSQVNLKVRIPFKQWLDQEFELRGLNRNESMLTAIHHFLSLSEARRKKATQEYKAFLLTLKSGNKANKQDLIDSILDELKKLPKQQLAEFVTLIDKLKGDSR